MLYYWHWPTMMMVLHRHQRRYHLGAVDVVGSTIGNFVRNSPPTRGNANLRRRPQQHLWPNDTWHEDYSTFDDGPQRHVLSPCRSDIDDWVACDDNWPSIARVVRRNRPNWRCVFAYRVGCCRRRPWWWWGSRGLFFEEEENFEVRNRLSLGWLVAKNTWCLVLFYNFCGCCLFFFYYLQCFTFFSFFICNNFYFCNTQLFFISPFRRFFIFFVLHALLSWFCCKTF